MHSIHGRLWSPSTTVLMQLPDSATPEDLMIFRHAGMNSRDWVLFYEAMISQHGNHPFFVARLATHLWEFGAIPIAERMYREVKERLEVLGIEDTDFDKTIERCANAAAKRTKEIYDKSLKLNYSQVWRLSREHEFPLNLPLPHGHEEIRGMWTRMLRQGDYWRYSIRHAIDTSHVEGTFLLHPESVRDFVRCGVDEGLVLPAGEGAVAFASCHWIKEVIRETVSGCGIVSNLANKPQLLTRQKICDVHARTMKTRRFYNRTCDAGYVPPGETRTATQTTTAVIFGRNMIECCPCIGVDEEVNFICDKAKEYIRTRPQNPFATASWLHLLLTQCHPFDGGNGRVIRMIASVPLIIAGYPMINVDLDQRAEYYEGIRRARYGDHAPLMKCFLDGMRKTLEYVRQM